MFKQRGRNFIVGCIGCCELRNVVFQRIARSLSTTRSSANTSTPLDFAQMPSPKGLPFIGTTFSLILAGGPTQLHKYMDKRHKELGPIFKDNVGPVTAVFLSDAEEMRNVFAKEGKYPHNLKPESWLMYNKIHGYSRGLFFMEGEEWWQHRKIMNHLLLKGNFNWIEDSSQIATELFCDRIKSNTGKEFLNLDKELCRWSMDAMIAILVGPKTFETLYGDLEKLINLLVSKVCLILETTLRLQLIPLEIAVKYQLKAWKRFEKAVTEALDVTNNILEHVRKQDKVSDGLLKRIKLTSIRRKVSDQILVDLILSAADTTTNTMAWSLYHLGKSKCIQDQLRMDLKESENPPLLRHVIKEILRLHPPAAFLSRVLPEPINVCDYHIPKDTLLLLSIYTSSRDERYFKNPDKFRPYRWIRESEDFPKVTATLPFGVGIRSCIGKRIAELKMQNTIRQVVQRFHFQLMNENEIENIWKMILMPSEPVRLTFHKV